MAAVLYFFADPASDRSRQDLQALAGAQHSLAAKRAVVLGISRAKLDGLKQVQRELNLRFPLLFDDRNFTAAYGIEVPEEGDPDPALFVVDRDQKILWMACPAASVEGALGDIDKALQTLPSQMANYPKTVVNRVVNWWVSKVRRPRAA